jgi:GPH family glycoside/pentoside/hexuronide:cation symporter
MNLLLRTAYTVFVVPYTALGFEICQDYDGRSKIQGIRNAFNMAANLCGPAMAWVIFFPNNEGDIKDTQIAQNYITMGTVFTAASFIFLFAMLLFTSKYIHDSRKNSDTRGSLAGFFKDVKDIAMDKYPRWVFVFMFFVLLGIVLVSTLQMYVFDDFMNLNGMQKSITHGGSMVGMALGSLSLAFFVKRFDKKGAIYVAVIWSVVSELILALLFLTGFIEPGQIVDGVPIAFILFAFFHSAYWFGNGIMMPVAVSMMADVSEINKITTGKDKDGSYAAMFSLATKISVSIASLVAGYSLEWTGFQSGANAVQTPESVWKVCALTFVVGPLASLSALALISKYPVTKKYIEDIRNNVTSLD